MDDIGDLTMQLLDLTAPGELEGAIWDRTWRILYWFYTVYAGGMYSYPYPI